jgi:Skp family chaperone for outer membrane proteins
MKTSRIWTVVIVALVGCVALLTNSLAQPAVTAVAGGVAVCDIIHIFNNYQRAKDLTADLNKRREAIKAETEKRNKVIEARQLELESYKKGSPKYKEVYNEITRLRIEAQAYLQYQEALALEDHRDLTKDMYSEITAMISQVSRQRGVSLVVHHELTPIETDNTAELLRQIRDRKVLYAATTLDITDAVLTSLNTTYKAKKAATTPRT